MFMVLIKSQSFTRNLKRLKPSQALSPGTLMLKVNIFPVVFKISKSFSGLFLRGSIKDASELRSYLTFKLARNLSQNITTEMNKAALHLSLRKLFFKLNLSQ